MESVGHGGWRGSPAIFRRKYVCRRCEGSLGLSNVDTAGQAEWELADGDLSL